MWTPRDSAQLEGIMHNKSLLLFLVAPEATISHWSLLQAKLPQTASGSPPCSPAGQEQKHLGKSVRIGPSCGEARQTALLRLCENREFRIATKTIHGGVS
jgi:hypothetical protein